MLTQSEGRTSNSAILRSKITLFMSDLSEEVDRFWNHPEFPEIFKTYLCHNHSVIRATVPLLRAAAQSCQSPQFADDPVAQGMVQYLEQHAIEETGHDEWILDDAEAMGLQRAELLNFEPCQAASHIVGSQYYWIHHHHPVSMLGYIAVMEGYPSSPEFFLSVARRNNLPEESVSSFVYHSKIDPAHKQDLDDLVDKLPLEDKHMSWMGLSALRSIQYLTDLLKLTNDSASLRKEWSQRLNQKERMSAS